MSRPTVEQLADAVKRMAVRYGNSTGSLRHFILTNNWHLVRTESERCHRRQRALRRLVDALAERAR